MSDPKTFEGLADWADQYLLSPYDGAMKAWVLINEENLKIGDVANAFYQGSKAKIDNWVAYESISVFKLFSQVPDSEDGWIVIYFEDIYFLKPYIRKSEI